jgi:hypothetical protein
MEPKRITRASVTNKRVRSLLINYEKGQGLTVEACKYLEFDHIYTTLARLAFRNEGLRPRQLARHCYLSEASLLTSLPQSRQKAPVLLAISVLLQQCGLLRAAREYPKLGYTRER